MTKIVPDFRVPTLEQYYERAALEYKALREAGAVVSDVPTKRECFRALEDAHHAARRGLYQYASRMMESDMESADGSCVFWPVPEEMRGEMFAACSHQAHVKWQKLRDRVMETIIKKGDFFFTPRVSLKPTLQMVMEEICGRSIHAPDHIPNHKWHMLVVGKEAVTPTHFVMQSTKDTSELEGKAAYIRSVGEGHTSKRWIVFFQRRVPVKDIIFPTKAEMYLWMTDSLPEAMELAVEVIGKTAKRPTCKLPSKGRLSMPFHIARNFLQLV